MGIHRLVTYVVLTCVAVLNGAIFFHSSITSKQTKIAHGNNECTDVPPESTTAQKQNPHTSLFVSCGGFLE